MSSNYTKPHRDYDSIPDEMKQYPQWVGWNKTSRPNGKIAKVPVNVNTGANADVTNSLDFTSFETAKAAFEAGKVDGIGFVFTSSDPFVGIDLDNAWDQEQADRLWKSGLPNPLAGLKSWASFAEKIAPYAYIALSQSGTGLHIVMKGKVPTKGGKRPVTRNGEQVGEIEIYGQDRFFAFTGITLSNGDISVTQQTPINQIRDHFRFRKEGDDDFGAGWGSGPYSGENWNTGLTDDEVIAKLRRSKKSAEFEALFDRGDTSKYDNDHSRGDIALVGLISYYTGPDEVQIDRLFRLSALYRDKWDRDDYRERTVGAVLYERGSERANYWSKDGKSKAHDEQASESADESKPAFEFYTIDEYKARPRPEWLIEGVLQSGSLTMQYGGFGTFKTFIALDMALSIAAGREWQGFKTRQGPVAYIIAEGGGHFLKRVEAWMKHNGVDDIPNFYMLPAAPLLNTKEDLKGVTQAVERLPEWPVAFFADTYARTLAGNENAQEDAGKYVAAAASLQSKGSTFFLTHHSGKNGDYRGSSALPGAADTIIRIERKGDFVRVKNEKQKDDAEFDSFNLKKVVIQLSDPPSDPDVIDLKPDTSLVFVRDNSKSGIADDLTPAQVQVLQILFDAGDDGLTHSEWLKAADLESRTQTFGDALTRLKNHNFLTQTSPRKKGNTYRVSDSGRAFLESTQDGENDES